MLGDLHSAGWALHPIAASAIIGSLWGIFPIVAAVVAFIYYCLQIYESKTLVDWRVRRRRRRVAKLREKLELAERQEEE